MPVQAAPGQSPAPAGRRPRRRPRQPTRARTAHDIDGQDRGDVGADRHQADLRKREDAGAEEDVDRSVPPGPTPSRPGSQSRRPEHREELGHHGHTLVSSAPHPEEPFRGATTRKARRSGEHHEFAVAELASVTGRVGRGERRSAARRPTSPVTLPKPLPPSPPSAITRYADPEIGVRSTLNATPTNGRRDTSHRARDEEHAGTDAVDVDTQDRQRCSGGSATVLNLAARLGARQDPSSPRAISAKAETHHQPGAGC